MRQRLLNLKIGPTIFESLDGDGFGNVERVKIGLIDLSEGLDQVGGVTFVAAELRSDGMRVDCDVQDRLRSSLLRAGPADHSARNEGESRTRSSLFFAGRGLSGGRCCGSGRFDLSG